jgi:hypothetical protein
LNPQDETIGKALGAAILNSKPQEAIQNEDVMRLFWTFIYERQEIFKRRYIEKKPDPWTEDWILRDYKFTNVYRELDRGTIYYIKNVLIPAEINLNIKRQWEQMVMDTLVYRHFNHIPTWEAVGGLLHAREWRKMEVALQQLPQVYTNAHNVTGFQWAGSVQKTVNSMYLVQNLWSDNIETIAAELYKRKDNMGSTWEYLTKHVSGLGGFTAYEVVVDFSYSSLTGYTDDDWVNPGPGCRRGLNRIYPGLGNNLEECREKIKWLRMSQRQWFKDYGLPFFFWQGKELTLRNIEHSLCEFSKYMKAYNREGRPRNNFTPCDWDRELTYVE